MRNDKAQSSVSTVAFILISLFIVIFIVIFNLPIQLGLIAILVCLVFLTAFLNTNFALVILIFAMLFSPKVAMGDIPGREIGIRLDDVFLIVVFFGWLAKMAINKELGLLRNTPINLPLLTYIFVCIVATLLGILRGYVRVQVSVFYFLKYLEYFLLFFMVSNNIRNIRQARIFVFSLILVAFLASVYAWIQHFSGVERVSAPFQAKTIESNTFGAYLLLMMMIISGLLLNLPSFQLKFFLGISLIFTSCALVFTLSRGSWLGILPAFATLTILTRKGKFALILTFCLILLSSSFIFPRYVKERIKSTFVKEKEYTILGKHFGVDESTSERIQSWKYAVSKLVQEPFIGRGVGTAPVVVDNQYGRVLIEVGLLGFTIFMWIMFVLFRSSMLILKQFAHDDFISGLSCGFIAGFIGLLFHALTAETFIIIRIMEPFWFLGAIVLILPQCSPSSLQDRINGKA